ncbi:MAG: hypothetical protein AB1486_35490, partial [Planctomycetota bacterium]
MRGRLSEAHDWWLLAKTADDGRFTLRGLSEVRQKIVAVHLEFAQGWSVITPGETSEVEIRLQRGLHVYGRVLDNHGL